MDETEKRELICGLIENVKRDILANVAKMPDDWDGHELRRYIADTFDRAAMTVGRAGPYGKPYRARTRAYRNAVLVHNL